MGIVSWYTCDTLDNDITTRPSSTNTSTTDEVDPFTMRGLLKFTT